MTKRQLRAAMSRMLEAEGAIDFMQNLMADCGYQNSFAPYAKDPQALVYCEAQRNIWIKIREYIPREKLILIENPMKGDEDEWTEKEILVEPQAQQEPELQHRNRSRRVQPQ